MLGISPYLWDFVDYLLLKCRNFGDEKVTTHEYVEIILLILVTIGETLGFHGLKIP
jgi:hypothetical protein